MGRGGRKILVAQALAGADVILESPAREGREQPQKAKRLGFAEAQLSTRESVSHQYVLSREILQIFKKSFYSPIFSNMRRHKPRDRAAVAKGTNLHNSSLEHLAGTLDTLCFQEHSRAIPKYFFLVRRPTMPFFLHQVSYTPEALARLIANPQDRFEAVRAPIEKLGGKVQNSYFAFGQYDAVLITEMPDNVSAAAIALAFAAGGAPPHCPTPPPTSNPPGPGPQAQDPAR